MKADSRIRTFAKSMRREMTNAETILWTHLKGRKRGGWQFRRQHPVDRYILDFACVKARLGVEVDGATHAEDSEIRRDTFRDEVLKAKGWDVLRVQNEDIYRFLAGVLDQIDDRLRFAGEGR
ncbi:endonuclease domain-containing protein [Hyphomonas sp.]|uniref:endonuclease domain-containing protein n=1 Tax=Hyphomonas sp. TaxID=87 RepID=UPI00391BD8C5